MLRRHLILPAALVVLAAGSGIASGHDSPPAPEDEGHDHQHGAASGHLPATSENVTLLSKLQLTNVPDKISDVAISSDNNTAFLGEWDAGFTNERCRGGIHVVDISNPTAPQKLDFLPSHQGTYATEGIHSLHVDTPAFTGELLVVSNETCTDKGIGGLTLWDVTNPRRGTLLSEGIGDFTVGDENSVDLDPVAHQAHSAMGWADGDRAYVVAIDNEESLDLDFFDVTDPANPVLIAETGLTEWPGAEVDAFGNFPTSHDFDVRNIDGSWYVMVSYWDAGWVLLNVDNPAVPVFVEDTDYPACDSFIGGGSDVDDRSCPPEGNAHQGEWNESGSLWLGTDEDFNSFRLEPIVVTGQTAPNQPVVGTQYEGGEFSWTVPISSLPDGTINGPTVFGGYGCDEDAGRIPPASVLDPFIDGPDEEKILVVERGPVNDPNFDFEACFFSIKVENAQNAGYDAVMVANHHVGAVEGAEPGAFFCGGQGHTFTITAHGLCTSHESMHEFFGRVPNYTAPYPVGDPGDLEPNPGDLGPEVETKSFFDGWGYVRLYEANPDGGFRELDQLAIDEETQLAHAFGSGDLTVHEVATERGPGDTSLAYFSWYSGGFRVADFNKKGIEEVGHFIDEGGNDFWGVQLAGLHGGQRVVAASDRDFGLYLFQYTP